MTTYEKKRKIALIAAAYYIEQEKATNATPANNAVHLSTWSRTGIEIAMNKRQVIQLRGKVLRRA